MAIVTGELYKGFTFGDVSSKDYGVYITQEAAYNAPDRDVEVVEIAGRNGAYILDKGRFKNITVSYKCGIALDDEQSFESAIRTFRNALSSKAGKYVRLEDEYNPNEYRQAAFLGGIEVDMADRRAGEFTVSFDAMPQRFLKSGETAVTIGGSVTNTQTTSGAVVSIDSDGGDAVTSLVAQIEPVQAGSGEPSPTNVRPITGHTAANVNVSGKNLITVTARTQTTNGVTFTFNDDGSVLVFAPSAVSSFAELNFKYSAGVRYLPVGVPLTVSGGEGKVEVRSCYDNGSGTKVAGTSDGSDVTFTIPENAKTTWARVRVQSGFQGEALIYPMVRLASDTDATWEAINGNTYPISFGSAGTVYGGTLDVVTGVLTVTHKMIDMGAYTWNYYAAQDIFYHTFADKAKGVMNCFSDIYAAKNIGTLSDFQMRGESNNGQILFKDSRFEKTSGTKSDLSGHICVYELATPQTYQLTAQQVELLTGNNNVWADTGDITITWGDDPNKLVNPTLYDAHPLLHVWGYGDMGINGGIISINNDEYGKILLANKVSAQQAQAVTYLDKSAQSMLNAGDSFDMDSGATVTVRLDSNLVPAINITNVTVTKTSTDDLAGMSISTSRFSDYAIITFSLPQVGFIYNTTTQVIKSIVNVVINYTQSGTTKTSTFTLEIRGQHIYRSGDSHQVMVSATKSTSNDFSSQFAISTMPIYGMSTKRPFADDADFYFDLDIGEAYKIEDGQTVSVNNAVTIPAQLPALKSGENTITYDDTITRFDVVPRWWEV